MTVRKKAQIAFVCFSVIPLILSIVIILSANVRNTEELYLDRIDKLAHISALAFGEIVDLHKNSMELLPTRGPFKLYTESRARYGEGSPVTRATRQALKEFLRDFNNSASPFNDVIILDEKGVICIGSNDRTEGVDLSGFDYYQKAVEANDPDYVFVSKVHRSLTYPDDPTQNCLALSRILSAPNGSIQGVAVAFIDADVVAGFTRGINFGKTGIAFAIDADNFILYHSDPRFFNAYTKAAKLENLVERNRNGQIPVSGLIYDELDGVMHAYYYVVIGDDGLVLILRQDYSEFTQDRNRAIVIAVITVLLAAVAALYTAVKISNNFVAPLLRLRDAFNSGRDKGKYVICSVDTDDEIGDMAGEYNAMIRKLERQFEEIHSQKIKTEHIALHDSITGLYNRAAFVSLLERAMSRDESLGVFFLDLDRFKQVNDVMGHSFGDMLLYMLGRRIYNSSAYLDACARIGGDEFLLYKAGTRDEIALCAQTIMQELRVPFEIENQTLHVTCSMGIAMYPDDGGTVGTLIKSADIAMYVSKDNGKNKFSFYSAEMQSRVDRHSSVMDVVRNCVEKGEVWLAYQPEIGTATGATVAYESLMRINNEKLGAISPGEFIPVAESDNAIIDKLGHWALIEACRFAKRLVDEKGFDGVVSVNISVSQLHRDNFVEEVVGILEQENLLARHLQIELTESILIADMQNNIKKLSALREKGVSIAMDDFGTHYSSLNYLIYLPLDVIKIDRSFFTEIETNERMMQINKAIIDLAHKLELKVVAEGVETESQYELIREIGCDIVQGYYFSRPIPEEKAVTWFDEHLVD